jgi:hypothetical protein
MWPVLFLEFKWVKIIQSHPTWLTSFLFSLDPNIFFFNYWKFQDLLHLAVRNLLVVTHYTAYFWFVCFTFSYSASLGKGRLHTDTQSKNLWVLPAPPVLLVPSVEFLLLGTIYSTYDTLLAHTEVGIKAFFEYPNILKTFLKQLSPFCVILFHSDSKVCSL